MRSAVIKKYIQYIDIYIYNEECAKMQKGDLKTAQSGDAIFGRVSHSASKAVILQYWRFIRKTSSRLTNKWKGEATHELDSGDQRLVVERFDETCNLSSGIAHRRWDRGIYLCDNSPNIIHE